MLGWLETLPAVGGRERMKRRREKGGGYHLPSHSQMSCPLAVAPTVPLLPPMNFLRPQSCVMSLPVGRRTTPTWWSLISRLLWQEETGYNWHGYEATPDMGTRLHLTWVRGYTWHGYVATPDMGTRLHLTWVRGYNWYVYEATPNMGPRLCWKCAYC